MAKQFTLGKKERLKSRKQIEVLFSEGKIFNITPFRVHYTFNEQGDSPLQFGAGVSHKNFRKAVDRNKIKRLIREAYRLQKQSLFRKLKEKRHRLNIFIIYTGKETPGYGYVFDSISKILEKLDRLTDAEK